MADDKRSHNYIEKVEIHDLRHVPPNIKIKITIIAGGKTHRSPTFKVPFESTPTWLIGLDVGNLSASTVLNFRLNRVRYLHQPQKVLIGSAKKQISELFNERCTTVSLANKTSPSSVICTLKIFRCEDPGHDANDDFKETTKPQTPLERAAKLLDAVEPIRKMIDLLSEDHPAAEIAWNFLLIGVDIVKNRVACDELVIDLYAAMLSTHERASRGEVLQKREERRSIYDALFAQTIECCYLIEGYAQKGVNERVPTLNLSDKAKEFHEGFTALRDQHRRDIAMDTPVVTLGIQQRVDDLIRKKLIRDIHPSTELRLKSTCMKGTRVETINHLMSWIAKCSGGMFWCSGLSGTGKSSLAGTLHEILTVHAGRRKRLGAFVRYDRIEYPDASRLIPNIAYSLGMCDNRIGTAISEAIDRNRAQVLGPSTASAQQQFDLLLRIPLESLPDLAMEGPIVIVIDGLDESDVTKETLAALFGGFGSKLQFMRLLVFSSPVESISRSFRLASQLPLDTELEHAKRDIRYFIDRHFSAIYADLSARNGSNTFQELCEALHAVDGLCRRASGLFIWAATACRFIRESPSSSESRVLALLGIPVSVNATDALTALYRTILEVIVSETDDQEGTRQSTRDILGAMMVKGSPEGMTAKALDTLVLPENPQARRILGRLGSVVHETSMGYYQLFHTSFSDFLQNRIQCGDQWYIDVDKHKDLLRKRRLEVLDTLSRPDLFSLLL